MCFFQAEDGIRDLVRSRGLGDVYKRQETGVGGRAPHLRGGKSERDPVGFRSEPLPGRADPVSYTHLTLPTSDLV